MVGFEVESKVQRVKLTKRCTKGGAMCAPAKCWTFIAPFFVPVAKPQQSRVKETGQVLNKYEKHV